MRATHDTLTSIASAVFVVAAIGCARPDTQRADSERGAPVTVARNGVCNPGPKGVIVSLDRIASFSTAATLGQLKQQCKAGDTLLYDAVGWQAFAWKFPFVGAEVVAVQSKHGLGDTLRNDEVPDLWTVEGDSVRMPDGELMPRTLGTLRSRYGFAAVDENIRGDDIDGPHARPCRYPYLLFSLAVNDTARHVPDSARITRVDMTGVDSVMIRYCTASNSVERRLVTRAEAEARALARVDAKTNPAGFVGPKGTTARECTTVPGGRIPSPAHMGVYQIRRSYRSGDFVIGGMIDELRARQRAKVWWAPLQNAPGMPALRLLGRSVSPQDSFTFTTSSVGEPRTPDPAKQGYFFPTLLDIPHGGTWVVVATSGSNWGCFVLTVSDG